MPWDEKAQGFVSSNGWIYPRARGNRNALAVALEKSPSMSPWGREIFERDIAEIDKGDREYAAWLAENQGSRDAVA